MAKVPFRPRPEGESNLAYNRVLHNRTSENQQPRDARQINPEVQKEFESSLNRLHTKNTQTSTQGSAELHKQEPVHDRPISGSFVTCQESPIKPPESRNPTMPALVAELTEEERPTDLYSPWGDALPEDVFDKPGLTTMVNTISGTETAVFAPLMQERTDGSSLESRPLVSGTSPAHIASIATIWKHVAGMDAREPQKEWRFTVKQQGTQDIGLTMVSAGAQAWNIEIHVGTENKHRLNEILDELKDSLDQRGNVVGSLTVVEKEQP